jgi:hypothetical protein
MPSYISSSENQRKEVAPREQPETVRISYAQLRAAKVSNAIFKEKAEILPTFKTVA